MPLVSLLSFLIHKRNKNTCFAYNVLFLALCCAKIHWSFDSCVISFPPLAPFPSGLVSLPQIERIQFFQESVKGQEESQTPLGIFKYTTQDPLTAHTPCNPPSNTNKRSQHEHTKRTHTRNPLPHSTDSISASWLLSCTFPLPPNILLFCD